MKVKITLSYDGSQFYGYQSQNNGTTTVANMLQDALQSLGIETKIHASGRTDRGVHASGQVIDIDIPRHWEDLKKFKNYLNRLCLPSIMIKDIQEVGDDFHARYSAKKRLYRYVVKEGEVSVFGAPYLCYHDKIDREKIEEAVQLFEGVHDFAYFCKSGSEPKSTIREIYKCRVYLHQGFYILTFEANGFLRSQIRLMVAFLLEIALGQHNKEQLIEQLTLKKKHPMKPAPANGLYLSNIIY